MKFSMIKVDDVVVVELSGEVWGGWDSVQLKDSVARLIAGGERRFLVDFKNTGSINSAGIGVLLAVQEKIQEVHGVLRLCEVNDRARRAFSISEVWDQFAAHATRVEALAALGEKQ